MTSFAGSTAVAIVGWVLIATGSSAAVISEVPSNFSGGNCSFGTACSIYAYGTPVSYAAQAFSLPGQATITSGKFVVLVFPYAEGPIAATYSFMSVDAGGGPGSVITSGFSLVGGRNSLSGHELFSEFTFDISQQTLSAGTYYFGLHVLTAYRDQNYLSSGALDRGAALKIGDGAWQTVRGSWAISLFGEGSEAVYPPDVPLIPDSTLEAPMPEPSTWAMLTFGFMGMGWSLRRKASRRRKARGEGPFSYPVCFGSSAARKIRAT